MKKKLVYSLVFILAVFLMVNYSYCVLSGNTSSDELTDSKKSLIKKFGYGGNYVKRWPDGYVDVYNGTTFKGMKRLIDKFNLLTGGKVIFRLSDNKEESQVIFQPYAKLKYSSHSKFFYDGYEFTKWQIQINRKYTRKEGLFLMRFTEIAGFNLWVYEDVYEKWTKFKIDRTIEKMLKALYKVPLGYNLLTEKVK